MKFLKFNKKDAEMTVNYEIKLPTNFISTPENIEYFQAEVNALVLHWLECDSKSANDKTLKDYPYFATCELQDVLQDDISKYNKYLENIKILEAINNYQNTMSKLEKTLLENIENTACFHAKLYAGIITGNDGVGMKNFHNIYVQARRLHRTYKLEENGDMFTTKDWRNFKKDIVAFYNDIFEIPEDTEMFKKHRLKSLTNPWVDSFLSDCQKTPYLKDGKTVIGDIKDEKACRKIFRWYLLCRLQGLNLDDAKKGIDTAIQDDTKKAEKAEKKDTQPRKEEATEKKPTTRRKKSEIKKEEIAEKEESK